MDSNQMGFFKGLGFPGNMGLGNSAPGNGSMGNNAPGCGGHTHRQDLLAPKKIDCREIVSFDTHFYLQDPLDNSRSGGYAYTIEQQADKWILKVGQKFEETLTDPTVLTRLQELIEKHDLIRINGLTDYTNGLPPEFQPCSFTAIYANGQKLYFYVQNAPDADWALDIRNLLDEYLAANGHPERSYKPEVFRIKQAQFKFNRENLAYFFSEIRMQDGSLKLLCNIYDMEAKKVAADEITEFPENYYERLQQCVEDCGLQKIHTGQLAIALPHTAAGYYEVYIDYASGRQIYAYSDDPAEVSAFLPMRDALMAFFGEIFHLS